MNKSLLLPAKQVTGYSGSVFQTTAKDWRGIPVRSSDLPGLPLAWTNPIATLNGAEVVAPAHAYGRQYSVIRSPRAVVFGSGVESYLGVEFAVLLTAVGPALSAEDIPAFALTGDGSAGSSEFKVFRLGLPWTAQAVTVDLGGFTGSPYSVTSPVSVSGDWFGGRVLYLSIADVPDGQTIVEITNSPPSTPTAVLATMPNLAAAEEDRVAINFAGHDAFAYDAITVLADIIPAWGASNVPKPWIADLEAAQPDLAAPLAAYNVTEKTYTTQYDMGTGLALNTAAIQAAIVARWVPIILAFFGL